MKKKLLLLLLCLIAGINVSAYDAEIDGIYYYLSEGKATVTFQEFYGWSAYSDYSGDVIIPESVTYNGETYSVTSIGSQAFEFCSSLTSVTIPNSVTSIGYGAFHYCDGLVSITIPSSVISIGDWVFQWCSGLTSIKVEEGNPVYDSRNGCNAIIETASYTLIEGCSSTIIPSDVTSIGDYAFFGRSNLTSIIIPNSVTRIGLNAFSGCRGLTSITIPESVYDIRPGAFENCYFVADSLINKSSYSEWEYGPTICDEETEDGLLLTNNELVLCRPQATSVIIPDKVTTIGSNVFRGNTALTSVTIPNSVTSISERAFMDCGSLTSVSIGSGVTSIGEYTFWGCNALEGVHITDLTAWCNITFDFDNDLYYNEEFIEPISSNPLLYAHHLYLDDKEITDLVIPEDVTKISNLAFAGCNGLTSVIMGNNLTHIGNYVFAMCKGLTSITFGNGLTYIGSSAFIDCSSIEALHISDLTAWCNIEFRIPIIFQAHHLYLNEQEIKDLVIPNGVTSIGDDAFFYCTSLTSVTFPESVTYIGGGAFGGCSGLTFIIIPSSVTSIYYWSFAGCEQLTEVYCLAENVPMTDESAFESSPIKNATLYVPEGSVEAYKARYPWSEFGTIVGLTQDMIDGIEDVEDSATLNIEEAWYSLDGRRLAAPQKGINIVNGRKILK